MSVELLRVKFPRRRKGGFGLRPLCPLRNVLRSFVCLQTDLVGIVAASGAGTHHLRQLASAGTLASSAVQPARQAVPLAEGVAMVERCCCSANPFAALLSLSATSYLRYAVSKLKPYRSRIWGLGSSALSE